MLHIYINVKYYKYIEKIFRYIFFKKNYFKILKKMTIFQIPKRISD